MSFDDPAAFLADFGVCCTAAPVNGGQAVSFVGLWDQPSALLDLGRASAHSQQYELRYITGSVDLVRNQAVTVKGVAYTCREAPRQLADGVYSSVLLTRI